MRNNKFLKSVFILNFVFGLSFAVYSQEKPDALKLYRNGRSLDSIGRRDDARKAYSEAISICRSELSLNPKNMDSYAVYTWCLFRLGRYKDTEIACNDALKVSRDARIIETLGEASFYLGNYKESLRNMENYIDMAPNGERISVAHFFVGEIYRIMGKYNKADIAYSIAVHLEPGNGLWWYRLGIVREAAGEKRSALDAFQAALRIWPDYKDAIEAVKRIRI
ncbi:tetratricopeptide repeat protein [Treponema pedis]|uniref:TPR protein n=2 Tax=Treponema pedis TaxID=409322 RepID=S5ZQB9_9SPIR|nr:tetratricopeptide repeat protein [Treponema pedis]AGT44847.1 TPR protein [Treponema pedis str. T A4]QOW60140.1 tetratricopeptide repeat protein [Treponema pedis]QSI05486.1 tetratricopeptide repeat protein [Treponema pedis]